MEINRIHFSIVHDKHFDKLPCKKVKIKPIMWYYRMISGYPNVLQMLK